jgi:hypothetical protein
MATGEATGNGSTVFTDPAVPVTIGPVKAIDGPGTAKINLYVLRYYFNQFLLDLGMYLYLNVIDIAEPTFTIPIVDFEIEDMTGNLWISPHYGTPDQLTAEFPIRNVAPTAVIDRSGTVMVNGVPTFMAGAGDLLTFNGKASDPGQDDLTLTWDYDDGDPSPDVSTHYTVPYHVAETQTCTLGDACVYMVTFAAVDDDGDVGTDQVPVVISAVGNRARSEGYWRHQLSQRGRTDFDMAAIQSALDIVCYMSAVFGEARDACTPNAAYEVMHLKRNRGSKLAQLDQELLAVWLNFANGACPYYGMVDTDEDGLGDTAFVDVLATAEAVRLDPNSTDEELQIQAELLHQINNGGMARAARAERF